MEEIELEEFVRETISQIESGAGGRGIKGTIDFKLLVAKTKKVGGGLKTYVVSGDGSISSEKTHEIKFSVYPQAKNESGELRMTWPDRD
jgi:hypothetical protein